MRQEKAKKRESFDIASNAVVLLFALLNLFPLYWLFSSSVKNSSDVIKMPPDWWPRTFTWSNYADVFTNQPALRWTLNSLYVAGFSTALLIVTSSMAAYAFSKLRFKGRNVFFIVFISSLMIPKEVMIVPLFRISQDLGLVNSVYGMIWPNVATAFGVFLLKGFFDTAPDALREAARIDGAGEVRTFLQIMLPIVKPGIGALFILNFVQVWNDYLWQLVIGQNKESKTLMVGIATLMQDLNPNFAYKMAGATVAAIPMLLIFILFQRYFTRGISIGAVKE
ncbi:MULTISPECIES: carbohydrate ABC transporter permease [unclassified Paenibacillus]|uniref:carbohydrate ABC transporter permease n=1 Tax=unclassified Paenibacillus TaxID=185978 RepID=UPI0009573EB3|nr:MULTISPECIES: carbohydrate ABC transporter permease [unclassified Paenibacillus]ASS66188.1 carbohydrate ABC transporter permease [Paenibacillus sp. RUD330]SIQ10213.1 multiple sugar transport system permease protein [Paenibacillus sp. RU4X]SIQ30883.1 multiple sugar transport system permease protein [Paenibacillus sp. RU4T]